MWQEAFPASGENKAVLWEEESFGGSVLMDLNLSRRKGCKARRGILVLGACWEDTKSAWDLIFSCSCLHGVTLEQQGEDQTRGVPLSASPMGLDTAQIQLRYFPIQHPGVKSESLHHRSACSGGCLCFLTHVEELRTSHILTLVIKILEPLENACVCIFPRWQ